MKRLGRWLALALPLFAQNFNEVKIELLGRNWGFTEGPAWSAKDNYLIFSDTPGDRLLKWVPGNNIEVFRSGAGGPSGNAFDSDGRLYTCETRARRVTRTDKKGVIEVLADKFQGKRLNAPNDIVVASDGGIWFTDPGYGILLNYEGHHDTFEIKPAVYRIDPSGSMAMVTDELMRPNGLCFAPDEKKLYIVDTGASHDPKGPRHLKVFDVDGGKKLGKGRVFANFAPGLTDGVRCDTDGNVWCSFGWGGPETNGVRVHAPSGDAIGFIHLPEICGNLCFGGKKRNRLFMCGSTAIYAVYVEAQGALLP